MMQVVFSETFNLKDIAMANVTESMTASRIVSHGKIAELPFKFNSFNSFSILVIPKASVTAKVISTPETTGLLVDCKCYQDDTSSDIPVLFNQWTEAAIVEIAEGAIDLATYDVYWGAGVHVEES